MLSVVTNFCSHTLQIFFHYSELAAVTESELMPGTSVEFTIQNRQVCTD